MKRAFDGTSMPETIDTDQDLVVAEFTLGNEDRSADEARTQLSFPMTAAQRGIWYAHQFDSEVPLSLTRSEVLRRGAGHSRIRDRCAAASACPDSTRPSTATSPAGRTSGWSRVSTG